MDYQEAHFFLFTMDKIKESEYKRSMEAMRIQTYYTVQPHLQKKTTPNKLMPFSWDKSTAPALIQDENIFKGFDKMFAKMKQGK